MSRSHGELHGRAVLTDDEVEALRVLRESELALPPHQRFWTTRRLAEKFEISRRQVVNIVRYHQRVSRGE